MLRTNYTEQAKAVVGPSVQRAGKTFLVIRCGDVFGVKQALRVTPDAVALFYATQTGNLLSGCRTLAGLVGDWRLISGLAKVCLDWFKQVNLAGMRRAARRRGLISRS